MGCRTSRAKNQFDSWSRSYDKSILQRIFFGPSHDGLIKTCHFAEFAQVLDVGCGTGRFARKLLDVNSTARMVGLDLSEKMLERAKANCSQHADRLELVQGNSESLPFDDGTFDVVTCVHSFHHYPNQAKAASEMRRVLKDDGQLCIVDGNRDNIWGWMIYDCAVSTIEGGVHHCSAAEFRNLLTEAGFGNVEQQKIGNIVPLLLTYATCEAEAQIKTLPMAANRAAQLPLRQAA